MNRAPATAAKIRKPLLRVRRILAGLDRVLQLAEKERVVGVPRKPTKDGEK